MFKLGTYQRKGSREYHGHCIHNDQLPKTHNFTMKGMFAAVVWIALWSLIIVGFISSDIRGRQRAAAFYQGLHEWHGVRRAGETVDYVECAKCGLHARNPGVQMSEGPCPGYRTLTK